MQSFLISIQPILILFAIQVMFVLFIATYLQPHHNRMLNRFQIILAIPKSLLNPPKQHLHILIKGKSIIIHIMIGLETNITISYLYINKPEVLLTSIRRLMPRKELPLQ